MIAGQRKKGLVMLKLLIKKLQTHLQMSRRVDNIVKGVALEEMEETETVPYDVKEGHFVVVAAKSEEGDAPIRFVVDLCFLNDPAFLRLLEMAEDEYGFQQKGALSIPCRPDDLRRIMQDKDSKKTKGRN